MKPKYLEYNAVPLIDNTPTLFHKILAGKLIDFGNNVNTTEDPGFLLESLELAVKWVGEQQARNASLDRKLAEPKETVTTSPESRLP